MTTSTSPTGSQRQRPRSPIRKAIVESVTQITPLLRRVALTGDELEGFGPPRAASHIKLHLVPEGGSWSPSDEAMPRPPRRTYTPRAFDPARRLLEVDFVLHGHGLAATWAERAAPGHAIYVSGPGGGYEVASDARSVIIVADDTALPAAGMILEAMPAGCSSAVLAEISSSSEERPLSPIVASEPQWLCRDRSGSTAGALLEAAVRKIAQPGSDSYWWVACEAAAMRRIRKHLLQTLAIAPSRVHTRGYWKLGETAYPDHDYGAD